ncbi:hypothetical protein ACHAXA_002706 [Cyclostephanos tholiformis]|uniref:Cytochrome P450 n=1 Tax=Cyclostephanos tholiformis TaxID=382380 RepID=A0ABD3R6B3_9STRA
MPQLSMPSLCIMSSLLLALVHGLKSLESKYSVFDGNGNGDGSGSCNLSHHPSDHPNHIRSPTTMGFEALLLPLIQSRLLYPTLFLLTLIFLLRLQYNRLQEVIRTTSPVPNVSPVPNAHPLFGHYSLLMNPCQHAFLFKDHATPSGISSMWGPGLKRCASVLLASHARLILRQTSQRDFSEWIIRHGRKTLGEDSLILIPGGSRWKGVRQVVARAFTHDVVRDQCRVIGKTARELVAWLEWSCDRDAGGGNAEDGEDPAIEARDFFKLYSFSVFGRTAMGYDFQSIPKGDKTRRHPHSSRECMPPEAVAFESLNFDIGRRAMKPSALMNPAMQLYWIPSRINRAYWRNSNMVNKMMGGIIGNHMDSMLRLSSHKDNSSSEGRPGGEDTGLRSSLLTYLIHSCMEKHFSKELSPACPFAASSSRPTLSSSSSYVDASSFKPPSNITETARRKIIQDVSKILHTLLLAGYETTALSLSYDLTLETGNENDKNGKGSHATILKGTRIIMNLEMIHRDERNFVRATEFVPERWVRWDSRKGRWVDRDYKAEGKCSMEQGPSSVASTSTPPSLSSEYTIEHSQADCIPAANSANFFAFSDGARNCVGRRLAIMESTLLIAELFRDLCVGFADENFELVKEINFVTVQPVSLPIKFWKR